MISELMYSTLMNRQLYMSLIIVLRLLGLCVSPSFAIHLREEIIKNKGTIKIHQIGKYQ
jgi:hypothetical protein